MLNGIDYNLLKYLEVVGNRPGWEISKQVSHIKFVQSFCGTKAFGIISNEKVTLPVECSLLLDIERGEMHIDARDVAGIVLVQNSVALQE